MADRVAIIGGSTAGRDHFPANVPDDVLPGFGPGVYPFSLDLAKASKWFWLARRWSVSVTLSATRHLFGVPSDASYSCSYDFAFFIAFLDPVTFALIELVMPADAREADLVAADRNQNAAIFGSGNVQADFDADPTFFGVEIKNFTKTNLGTSKTFSVYLNPFSYFWVSGTLRPPAGFDVSSHDFTATTSDSTTGPPFNAGNFEVDGEVTPIWAINTGSGSDHTDINSVDCTVTPLSYWPYATKAGLPVYDTSTGAQLEDPFS